MKGDRVRLHQFLLYKGESMPDLPPEQWTGIVVDTWGSARHFVRVQRDYDGRVIPMMAKGVAEVLERAKAKSSRGRR
ncbi:hypothetical protein [Paenibacillus sp. 32O-W]|uniref:hypothetical protein n=1 Tax=Paenibacillus sp. 32O-W TaxID=1695218 RepID=UPI0011A7F857|nr:hypothetical protein [Paenibacillus sp. 32O-W]